jgi:dihydropteroate synthase
MRWLTTRYEIDLTAPRVMGIVNVTPDSFSDGGRDLPASLAHCETLLREGAHILDIGGESTRPGARKPGPDEEWARVEPVLRHALRLGVPVSVDTSSPAVMRAALGLGADILNDVRALREPGALEAVAGHPRAGVCLMHMRGEPASMQEAPVYADVVAEVAAFLRERLLVLNARGVASDRIVLDPGIGFGKTVEHNLALLKRQRELLGLGAPLLVGWSRKSTLGRLIGREGAAQRQAASVAAALAALQRGARIVRVHDVQATVDALAVWQAAGLLEEQEQP